MSVQLKVDRRKDEGTYEDREPRLAHPSRLIGENPIPGRSRHELRVDENKRDELGEDEVL
jgi:hypothetical protein